jgi:hypothetical protein
VTTLNPHHHEKFVMPVDALLPKDLGVTLAQHRWRTCAVVGNSGALTEGVPQGVFIDQHDVVLRINQAPTIGYEQFVRARSHPSPQVRVGGWSCRAVVFRVFRVFRVWNSLSQGRRDNRAR